MTTVYVIPCGAAKLDRPAPARDLYTGAHFRYVLDTAAAEAAAEPGARVMILSARHGLLDLDQVVAPYDVKMGDPGAVDVDTLAGQLRDVAADNADTLTMYGFLPAAYLRALAAAADTACDAVDDDFVTVHDVYEAALPGIGYQRGCVGAIRRFAA